MTTNNEEIVPTEQPQKKKRSGLFNRTIFKQTFKSNWKLWLIFTGILSLFISISIAVFDPIAMSAMRDMFAGMAGDDGGEALSAINFTLTGTLAMMFFGMIAVVLPMIYVLITAHGLIAAKVDRGSMAYTLSTPIKRQTVVVTKALYLIGMITSMFAIVTVVGLSTVQIAHGSLFGPAPTADVVAVARHLNTRPGNVTAQQILDNDELMAIGAEARRIPQDARSIRIYEAYLNLKISPPTGDNDADNDLFDGIPESQVQSTMMTFMIEARGIGNDLSSDAAIQEAANNVDFSRLLTDEQVTLFMLVGGYLDEQVFRDSFNFNAFVEMIINHNAASQVRIDEGFTFAFGEFMLMMLGALLFALAVASIGFFFSAFFNLSKHSIALGTGIPVGMHLLQTISGLDSSLNSLRFLSMNELFSPSAITSGGVFWWQFLVLGGIALTLFTLAICKFKKKDLPL